MKRTEQYRRKLEFIIEKISVLPDKLDEDKFHVDALFYRLQVSIDAVLDVIAMLCKDLGIIVKDDYSNIDELEKIKIFSSRIIKNLRCWNGLRNVLVNKYNKIDEDLVAKEKNDVVTTLKTFVKDVEVLINKKLNLT